MESQSGYPVDAVSIGEWPTQSGDVGRLHQLSHDLLFGIGVFTEDHVEVIDFCEQVFDVVHKSLAK